MPSPEPTSDNSDDSVMPEMVSKRRGNTINTSAHPPLLPKQQQQQQQTTNSMPTPISFVAGRRRRLFAYFAAFAIMLALSSMLDLRRAAISAKRHDRITLQPPPGPPATAIDEDSHPADGVAVAHEAQLMQQHNSPPRPPPLVSNAEHSDVHGDEVHTQPADVNSKSSENFQPNAHAQVSSGTPDRKLSDQELADDVDQLISHVEQENAVANTTIAAPTNGSKTETTKTTTTSSTITTPTTVLKPSKGVTIGTSNTASPVPVANLTVDDPTATVEEQFAAAQTAMDALVANETLKLYLDAQEARTLKALALQGARGDCEKAAAPSGGSLFKTDAEAASGDIEKTDALWGAWCVFSGRYRSDAMRDYVVRTRTLRARLVAKAEAKTTTTKTEATESFDETAATLDDVLPPEEQAALRKKAESVVSHLSESDARLLAALALQATLGDCGLYAKIPAKKRDEKTEHSTPPRELVEPLFGKKTTRGEGTLWGAWCVFARRKRATAVATLKDRIEQFYKQLADN